MTHPLTEEMIEQIAQFEPDLPEPLRFNRTNDMRSASDWQLERVKEEVKRELKIWRKSGYNAGADVVEDFFEDVMLVMRPQNN